MPRKVVVKHGAPSLTDDEFAAWSGFVAAHSRLARQLDDDLRREHQMSLASYDALLTLWRAPDRRLRMSSLAEAVHFSQGGLTKLVARLEEEGLVRREPDPSDGRALFAVLTDAGLRRLVAARAAHLAGVRRYFLAHLSPAETTLLGDVWQRILDSRAGPPE